MSFETNLQDFATRVGTECKALRTLINGNALDLSGLTTTAKNNLVAAINEIDAAVTALEAGGAASSLDELTDVTINLAAAGHVLRHNGTEWVNVVGTTHFQARSTELDNLAAQTSTAYGRQFLTLANQAALMSLVAMGSETAAGILELASTTEATAGTDTTRAVTPAGLQAALNSFRNDLVNGAPGLLDTLDEIAAALGDDPNFATTVTTALGNRVRTDTAAQGLDATQKNNARTNIDVYSKAEIGDINADFVATFEAGLT